MRVRIIFAGTPEVALPSLKALEEAGHDILAVLTRAPARVGRKRELTPSPVHTYAEECGYTVLTPDTLRSDEAYQQIASLAPEAIAVVAYGLIIPADLLEVPTHGWINLHFSALPRWRGAAPAQYSIAAGDAECAASVFRIEEGLDTGPIYAGKSWQMPEGVTAGELLARLAESGAELLASVFADIEAGTATLTPQAGEATYARVIKSRDARIHWREPAEVIERKIRAFTPAPGAWTMMKKTRIKIGPVSIEESRMLPPGRIEGDLVGTGTCCIRLGDVAPAGKSHMPAQQWLRGARLPENASFELDIQE